MCEYCEKSIVDCNEGIIESTLKVGGLELIGMQVYICDNQLYLFVDETMCGREIKTQSVKIKYCPMCGRQLEDQADQASSFYALYSTSLMEVMKMICDLCGKDFEVPEEWTESKTHNYIARRLGGVYIVAKVCEDCAPIMFAKTRACITKCSFDFWDKFKEGRNNGVF